MHITSLGSISGRTAEAERTRLHFEIWGQGPIFDWYNSLDSTAKAIEKIQIWKASGAVPHRFVVLHMRNQQIHRFDRRPDHALPSQQDVKEQSSNRPNTAELMATQDTASPIRSNRLGDIHTSSSHETVEELKLVSGKKEENPSQKGGRGTTPAQYSPITMISNQAVHCEDSYVLNIDLAEVAKVAKCEIQIALGGQVGILAVISICYAIQKDEKTCNYSLFRFNCFFFSWTILMAISRHNQPYEAPEAQSVIEDFESIIGRITPTLVEEAIASFLDLVIETLDMIREKAYSSLYPGMGIGGRFIWSMPTNVRRFFWRQLFNTVLHCGLRKQLIKKMEAQMKNMVAAVQEVVLSTPILDNELNKHLWIEDTGPRLEELLKQEAMKIFWHTFFEAIAGGFGFMSPHEIKRQMNDPGLKLSLVGQDAQQFFIICSAGLHGGLQAAKSVSTNLGTDNEEAFNKLWNAASRGALLGARIAAGLTGELIEVKQERIDMYNHLWGIWDDCWAEAREKARPRIVHTVNNVIGLLIKSGAAVMIHKLKECRKIVGASMPSMKPEQRWLGARPADNTMTTSKLQEAMCKMINSDTINADTSEVPQAAPLSSKLRDLLSHLTMTDWNSNPLKILDKYVPQTPDDPTERLLRALVAHAPTKSGRQNVCEDILKCGGAAATGESNLSEQLYDLGRYYISTLLVPILRGDRPHQDRFINLELEDISLEECIDPILIEEAKSDIKKTKALAMVRDNCQCVISGLPEVLVYKARLVRDVSEITHTTATPILPLHLASSRESAAAWAALCKFSGINVAKEFSGNNINRLGNITTIALKYDGFFPSLYGWLEAVEDKEHTYSVCAGHPAFALPIGKEITFTSTRSELELPDPRLIAIHAACAKVVWSSDMVFYLDRIIEDLEELTVLAEDSSSDALLHALSGIALRTK